MTIVGGGRNAVVKKLSPNGHLESREAYPLLIGTACLEAQELSQDRATEESR